MADDQKLQWILEAKDNATLVLRKVGEAQEDLTKKIEEASKNTDQLTKSTDLQGLSFGKLVGSIFTAQAAFSAASQAVGYLKDQFNESVQMARDFDNEMRRANTIMGLAQDEFAEMERQVLQLTKTLPFSAEEMASALFDIASAGISAENQIAFLNQAAIFATAGFTDMNTAVQGLSAAIKGFNLTEQDAVMVSNLFFEANRLGQTTVEAMATALQRMTSSAQIAGISIEETMTFFATFTGVTGNASDVATQFRSAVAAIAQPTGEVRKRVDEMNAAAGEAILVFGDGAFEGKNFAEVAREIYDAVDGDAEQLRKLVPDVEAATLVIAAATTQYDDFNEKLGEVQLSLGATEIAFEEAMKSHTLQLQVAQNNFDQAKIRFGQSMSGVLLFLTRFLLEMEKSIEVVVAVLGSMVRTFGAVVSGIIQSMVKVVGEGINLILERIEAVANKTSDFAANLGMDTIADKLHVTLPRLATDFKSFGEIWGGVGADIDANGKNMMRTLSDVINGTGNIETDFVEQKAQEIRDAMAGAGGADLTGGGAGADDLKKMQEEMADSLLAIAEDYDDAVGDIEEDLAKLTSAHETSISKIEAKISDLRDSLKALEEEYASSMAGINKSEAEAVIGQEDKIAKLKDQLAELQGKDAESQDSGRIAEVQAELKAEEDAYRQYISSRTGLEEELAEARRRQDLTSFERFVEDITLRREAEQTEFELKKTQIEEEISSQEAVRERENAIYEAKKSQYEAVQAQFQLFHDSYVSNLVAMESQTAQSVQNMAAQLEELKNIIEEINSLTSSRAVEQSVSEASGSASTTNNDNSSSQTNVTITVSGESNDDLVSELTRQLELLGLGAT